MTIGPKAAGGALFAIILAAVLAGCGNVPADGTLDDRGAPSGVGGDPDTLLAAALQAWAADQDAARALQLATEAAVAAARRPDAAWLHLRLCQQTPRCDAAPLEARLKELAPDNGVVWLSVLERAQRERDGRVEAQVLDAMSRAAHFNLYWTALVQRLATASGPRLVQSSPAPMTNALSETSRRLSALALPSFAPLATACSAERMRDPARRSVCERIAQSLERSDSYIAEGAGLGIAQRLTAPGSAAALAVEERIETLAYQSQTAASVAAAQVEREKFSAEVIELMKQLPREQDVSLAILRWAGEPLTP